jgi:hypothetical protein
VLAGGVQSCEDYQAAARQCSERLEKLRLRAGGHAKRDMLVQWRQDNFQLLHVAGQSPLPTDPGLLRLTS